MRRLVEAIRCGDGTNRDRLKENIVSGISTHACHISDASRRILTDFFESYNQQLYRLIDEDFGWN
jgi:DNA-directed RNA polymerase alpha subunit